MSTTGAKPKTTQESHDINKLTYQQTNPSYTLRVICCVLFIFLTEICLSHYVYRLISSEIREDYVQKRDVEQYILNNLRSGVSRDELSRIIKEINNLKNSSVREKRSVNILDDDDLLNLPQDEPVVDFFHPSRRSELQEKDENERQKTGKGTAPGGDNWVWLTNYCRVTMASIQGYCSDVKKYCPPSPPGPKGPSGPKGERGDTGYPGIPGPPGPRGHAGHIGEKGLQGLPGLDGRDGVPGEPGFDGMPGRNGHDGIPGIDGTAGLAGKDGRNGTDGRPGLTGPVGPPGPQGPKGLTGPRGRSGKPGNHGTPGIPGINAWKTKVNGSTELLIPPSIAGRQFNEPLGPAIITEGDNVTLHCAASGVPKPTVEWIRSDGQPIQMGPWQSVAISGHTINIILVSRVHMGTYVCIADNGIPPQVNQTFILEIHFIPLIRIRRDKIGVSNGSTAVLECEVESFPEAVRYWERSDERLLESSEKYRIDNTIMRNGYTIRMQLNITRTNSYDLKHSYYCVAKNEKGATRGKFEVYEYDARKSSNQFYDTMIEVGQRPPKRVTQESVCPPPVCPECIDPKNSKCNNTGLSLIDLIGKWEIIETNLTAYPDRTTDCVLYAVGKPVFHRFTNKTNGAWMRDPLEKDGEKFYVTYEENDKTLLEYENKEKYRKNDTSKTHTLVLSFKGNAHVVYNGSFYYNTKNKAEIIKMDLSNGNTAALNVTDYVLMNISNYLYSNKHNYLDFSIDDNGLWVIYGIPNKNNTNTGVMKIDADKFSIQKTWNISLNHSKVGDMFVVCGVLYAVDSVTDRECKIRFALDLYKNILLDVNLPFTNPFRSTTMVGYDHKHKELYTWDKGNQLTYPVRYHEIGYKSKDEVEPPEPAALQTGLEIYHTADNTEDD